MSATPDTSYFDAGIVASIGKQSALMVHILAGKFQQFGANPGANPVSVELASIANRIRIANLRGPLYVIDSAIEAAACIEQEKTPNTAIAAESLQHGLAAVQRYLMNAAFGRLDSGLVLYESYLGILQLLSGKNPAPRGELFLPVLPPAVDNQVSFDASQFMFDASRLCQQYRAARMGFAQQRDASFIATMRRALLTLEHKSPPSSARLFVDCAIAFMDIAIKLDADALLEHLQLIERIERDMERLSRGDLAIQEGTLSWLLYVIASAEPASRRVSSLQETYSLKSLLVSDHAIAVEEQAPAAPAAVHTQSTKTIAGSGSEYASKIIAQVGHSVLLVEHGMNAAMLAPEKANLTDLTSVFKAISSALLMLDMKAAADFATRCNDEAVRILASAAKSGSPVDDANAALIAKAITCLGQFASFAHVSRSRADASLTEGLSLFEATQHHALANEFVADNDETDHSYDLGIAGIIYEDALEVCRHIEAALMSIRQAPANIDALSFVRRSFHTLKGGARMADMNYIGDVAWSAERVLNEWLARRKPNNEGLLDWLSCAATTIATEVVSLKSGGQAAVSQDEFEAMAEYFLGNAPRPEQVPQAAQGRTVEQSTDDRRSIDEADAEGIVVAGDNIIFFDDTAMPSSERMKPSVGFPVFEAKHDGQRLLGNERQPQLSADFTQPQEIEPADADYDAVQWIESALSAASRLRLIYSATDEIVAPAVDNAAVGDDKVEIASDPLHGLMIDFGGSDSAENLARNAGLRPAQDVGPILVEPASGTPSSTDATTLVSGIDWQPAKEPDASGLGAGAVAPSRVAGRIEARADFRGTAQFLDSMIAVTQQVEILRHRIGVQSSDSSKALMELDRTLDILGKRLEELACEAKTRMRSVAEDTGTETVQFRALELDGFTQLQEIARRVAEGTHHLLDHQLYIHRAVTDIEDACVEQAMLIGDLTMHLDQIREISVSAVVPRLRRAVRAACMKTGKHADIIVDADIEMDRGVLERVLAPVEHILHNAVKHGIEMPTERVAFGKAPTGLIEMRAYLDGDEIVIEIEDDGAGIDEAKIFGKAVQRGVIQADAEITADEIHEFLFAPWLSTMETATELSRRKMGLDVVHSEVEAIGGRINLMSENGVGTRFAIRVAASLSVVQGAAVTMNGRTYVLPVAPLDSVIHVDETTLRAAYECGQIGIPDQSGGNAAMFELHGLWQLVGMRDWQASAETRNTIVVLSDSGIAVHVDQIQASRKFVFKPMGERTRASSCLMGSTVDGMASRALVINPTFAARHMARTRVQIEPTNAGKAPLVLVVDASMTVRRLTGQMLDANHYRNVSAGNGMDALDLMQSEVPSIILMGIEMPKMDGYECTRAIRADPRFRDIPIIAITSGTAERDRDIVLETGANELIAKPCKDQDLLQSIARLVGNARSECQALH